MGIDIEHGFKETYEVIPGKEKVLARAQGGGRRTRTRSCSRPTPTAKGRPSPGTSPRSWRDRSSVSKRVEFHEITKKGVERGVANPRKLDTHLYDAQRARRVLDRIVGYDVSALVWSKLAFGLSAGRVQSVALRLIVDRERGDRGVQVPRSTGTAAPRSSTDPARPTSGRRRSQQLLRDASTARMARSSPVDERRHRRRREGATSRRARYKVAKVTKSERKRNAPAPYTHEQAAAGRGEPPRLRRQADDAGRPGALRGDRPRQGRSAPSASSRTCVPTRRAARPRRWTRRASTSPRSTARRSSRRSPTSSSRRRTRRTRTRRSVRRRSSCTPERVRKHLKDEQFKLYKLIWNRFVASQMSRRRLRPDDRRDRGDVRRGTGAGSCTRSASAAACSSSPGWLEAYGVVDATSPEPSAAEGGSSFAGEETEAVEGADAEAATGAAKASGANGASAIPAETDDATLPELTEAKCSRWDPAGRRHRAEVHAAAAALHGRLARARARGPRHRAAEHVRRDHQQGAGARLRREGRWRARSSGRRRSASSSSTGW